MNVQHTLQPLLAALALLVCSACCKRGSQAANGLCATVSVYTARSAVAPVTEDVVATVRAYLRAVVSAKVSASVEAMNVVPGQAVTAGFVIASLNAREIAARRNQAAATRDQAQQDFARTKQLFDQKIASQQEYDTAETRLRTSQAALDETDSLLGYTEVRAPFAGVVTTKLLDQGDLATPGRGIAEIENPDRLRLEAEVPEAALGRLRQGDSLPVTIDAALVHTNAVVGEISPVANPVNRTVLIKLDLPRDARVHPGQFGRVAVPVGDKQMLAVPTAAVVSRGQLDYVFVVKDNRAVMRIVRTGRRAADTVEILAGLRDGEPVVASGSEMLRDGAAVATTR